MDMVCKCGGKEFFTEEHGNLTGLYCSACGKWQKWLKKDEIRLYNHGMIPSHDVAMQNASLPERLKARIAESAIKVSTVKTPRLYMKADKNKEIKEQIDRICRNLGDIQIAMNTLREHYGITVNMVQKLGTEDFMTQEEIDNASNEM